ALTTLFEAIPSLSAADLQQLEEESGRLKTSILEERKGRLGLGPVLESNLTAEEEHQVQKGSLIWAIKSVRTRTGLGLREAKDLVDAYMGRLGLPVYRPSFGTVAKLMAQAGEQEKPEDPT